MNFAPSSSELAAATLELRRRAKLLPFDLWLRKVTPAYSWDWPHLAHMRIQLDRIHRREIDRLWLFCPPRHGKSTQNTVRFAAWEIENDPSTRVIVWAHTSTLARRFSRQIRRIVRARGVPLNRERQAADDWETAYGGGVRAAGVDVAIAGQGADLIIIDDPIRGRKQAQSQAMRDAVHEGYTDDLVTRLEPGGAIVGTVTRWHEDDLPGRIAVSEEGHQWVTVNLPAIAEEGDPLGRAPGEALCPERYPIEVLERRKLVLGRTFFALFQGRPAPASGNRFRREWFVYYRTEGEGKSALYVLTDRDGIAHYVPVAGCRRFGTMDLASSTKTGADYTVIASWAVTPRSDLLLLDLVRARIEGPDMIRQARLAVIRNRLAYLAVETNAMGLGAVQTLRRGGKDPESNRMLPGVAVRGVPSLADKLARASTAIVRCEAGQVYFPDYSLGLHWLPAYEAELLTFDDGAHDDQVDVTSMAADDVFWTGGSPESDNLREAREEAREIIEREKLAAVRDDPDDERWWGR